MLPLDGFRHGVLDSGDVEALGSATRFPNRGCDQACGETPELTFLGSSTPLDALRAHLPDLPPAETRN